MSVLGDLKVYACGLGWEFLLFCGYYSPSIYRLNFSVSLWGDVDFMGVLIRV
jgi:hypothetical protein